MAIGGTQLHRDVEREQPTRVRSRLSWVIFVLGIVLSIVAFLEVRDWEDALVRIDFEMLSASHAAAIDNELIRHFDASSAMVGLYAVSPQVTRGQFERFASTILASHNDTQAMMWAPAVAGAQMRMFLDKLKQDQPPDYRIHDINGVMIDINKSSDNDAAPIIYVHSAEPEDDLPGLDLMSDTEYRQLLETARDNGHPTVSGPVQLDLKHANTLGNGVLLVSPVYLQDSNLDTLAGRRAGLEGYVLQLFRLGDVIEEGLRESAVLGLDISVVYGKDPDTLQRNYFHASPSREGRGADGLLNGFGNAPPAMELRTPVDILGKSWALKFTPAPRFWSNHPTWTSWAVLASGILLTLFLTCFALLRARRQRAETSAMSRPGGI